jgi:type II secretory pathway component PulJ
MERKLRSSSANSMPDKGRVHVEGLLNIDKPGDRTSHDVVAHIRRLTRIPRRDRQLQLSIAPAHELVTILYTSVNVSMQISR